MRGKTHIEMNKYSTNLLDVGIITKEHADIYPPPTSAGNRHTKKAHSREYRCSTIWPADFCVPQIFHDDTTMQNSCKHHEGSESLCPVLFQLQHQDYF